MSGIMLYAGFCLVWLIVGGLLLLGQLLGKLRRIEQLRMMQAEEQRTLQEIQTEIGVLKSETEALEAETRKVRTAIHRWEQRARAGELTHPQSLKLLQSLGFE